MAVKKRSYLLLRPEDTADAQDGVLYAQVTSVGRSYVGAKPLSGPRATPVRVARAVAERRLVNAGEATDHRTGLWLRKAVCYTSRRSASFGQVIGYEKDQVLVATFHGVHSVKIKSLIGEVYPVLAMTLGFKRWSRRTWPAQRLESLQEQVFAAVLAGDGSSPLTVAELRSRVRGVEGIPDRQLEWMDPNTGERRIVSVEYVLKHVFYTEGSGQGHTSLDVALGPTFCNEPDATPASGQAATVRSEDGSLFDPLPNEMEARTRASAAAGARAFTPIHSQHQFQGDRGDSPGVVDVRHHSPRMHSPPKSRTLDEIELIELIRLHKPHHLGFYPSSTSDTPGKRGRVQDSQTVDPTPPAKRARTAFNPPAEQERVHRAITATAHIGKSGDAFLEFFLSHPTAQFTWHPGVLARVNELQFGRGLSLMHFERFGFLDRLARPTASASLGSDFSVNAPPALTPASWAQLASAAHSFHEYTSLMCDPITIGMATAIISFIGELEGWQQVSDANLPFLVRWLDSVL